MQRIDAFQRANIVSPETQSSLRLPRIYLWHDGKLLYRSSDASESPVIPRTGALFEVSMDGVPWRAYAEDSADARARFAALTPATPEAFGFTPWSRGWVVLPLLVSLPLLIVPAWLSVRFALRPWAALLREIAARGGAEAQGLVDRLFATPKEIVDRTIAATSAMK